MDNKFITGALVILMLLVLGLYFKGGSDVFGATGTRMPNGISADSTSPSAGQVRGTTFTVTGATTLGSSGTSLTQVNVGTCYLLAYAATIAASTTATVTCQGTAAIWNLNQVLATTLTGVANGDFVLAQLSTTTASVSGSVFGGLVLEGASASSTAGYITLRVYNNTGAIFTWPLTGNATGTASYISVN